MEIKTIISTTAFFLIGLAAYTSLLSFRNNLPVNLRRLSALWLFVFAVELTGRVMSLYSKTNLWLYNISDIILFLSLTFIFMQQHENRMIKLLCKVFIIAFPLFVIANYLFFQGPNKYHSYTFIFGGIFLIMLAGAYIWQLYKSDSDERISEDPFFWFSCGFLIYFGGYMPFLGMYNYLVENFKGLANSYFYISISFSIILNLSIITGYLCRKQYQK